MRTTGRPTCSACAALLCLLAVSAAARDGAAREGRLLTPEASAKFMRQLVRKERRFFQPGISYDAKSGMTYDGHPVDIRTGELRGLPRNWSAASKEMLHIGMLVKAVEGDHLARRLLTPDPNAPHEAVDLALDVLERKISSYEDFHRRYPGYGGFLPWYRVQDGKIEPTPDWKDRVPSLDNGQLAWALYMAAHALRDRGHDRLADRYQAQLDLMRKNVVPMFYDRASGHFRAEAKIVRGTDVKVADNEYVNNGYRETLKHGPKVLRKVVNGALAKLGLAKPYLLDDPYEGLMLVHFADLMGDWSGLPRAERERPWRRARRRPRTYFTDQPDTLLGKIAHRLRKKDDGRAITVEQGHWASAHERWGDALVLPFLDLPLARTLFENGVKVQTRYSAKNGWRGLFASVTRPVRRNTFDLQYVSGEGIPGVGKEPIHRGERVFAPYATFPLAIVDKQLFASWLEATLDHPGASGPYGIGESYTLSEKSAPVLTWDGKALPMMAYMGGITDEIRRYLQRDQLPDGRSFYDAFMARNRAEYRLFDPAEIEGKDLPFAAPPEHERKGGPLSFVPSGR